MSPSTSSGGSRSARGDDDRERRDPAARANGAPGRGGQSGRSDGFPPAAPGDDPYGWSSVAEPEDGGAARSVGRKLRRPHRRRAKAGEATGLDPNLASDLPSWLAQERVRTARPRRLRSLSVAGFSALLGLALIAGAELTGKSFGYVVLAVQVLFVLAWTVALRPPGARVVAAVGLLAAAAADFAVLWPDRPSLAPLAYVTAGAFVLGAAGQLLRGANRESPTESLGATLTVVVGVVAFGALIVLNRHPLGTQSIVACLTAAAVALTVARLVDIVLPSPRTSSQVPRGSFGVVLGAMAGTAAAGVMGSYLVGLHPTQSAIAGLVTAMVAVMADLAVSYSDVSRELDGEPSAWWLARHMQGPLGGLALASAAAYVLSVMLLIPSL